MARSAQIQLLLISVLTARAALGQRPPQGPQNSDLSILGGPVIATQAIADANVPVHFNGVFSLQSNFAHTIHSYSFADLWLEFPSTSTFRGNDEVGGGIKSASFDATFGTPGVRLHVPVGRRGSFYGAVGAGYGRCDYNAPCLSSGWSLSFHAPAAPSNALIWRRRINSFSAAWVRKVLRLRLPTRVSISMTNCCGMTMWVRLVFIK